MLSRPNKISNKIQRTSKTDKKKLVVLFEDFTGHEINSFTSINKIINWMQRPTDAAALGIFRILFGLCMLIDIPEERGGGHLDLKYGHPKDCHFPLFDAIEPLCLPKMGIIYSIMWLGAFGIMLGYNFKLSCLMFSIPYWYIFLLDKPAWNNHSYLYGLCGVLLLFTNADRYRSLNSKILTKDEQSVPYWNYFLIKFQFFILYFIAGCKKLTLEWLSGYAMQNLGYHYVFTPFKWLMDAESIELFIIHWLTAIFDFTIAFWMTWKRSRIWATPFLICFHLMNSRLFTIGLFPWVCLAELPLFYSPSWPRLLRRKYYEKTSDLKKKPEIRTNEIREKGDIQLTKEKHVEINKKVENKIQKVTLKQKLIFLLILSYMGVQFFLPYSHFITKGYNGWTNGLYGYSWDMMVHSYDTIQVNVRVVDNNNRKIHYLEPYAFTNYDRWTKNADMAKQYAKCIERNLIEDYKYNDKTDLTSMNFSIYFDIWCSMNGRFKQRVFKPIDILKAPWSYFQQTEWILPVLNELNYMRPKLHTITNEVFQWSNYSDVLFIADFPGFTLENHITDDLRNVTLTVLEGSITLENQNGTEINVLNIGDSKLLPIKEQHRITTVSSYPSSYMYTFINKTMEKLSLIPEVKNENFLLLWEEFLNRAENYRDFFYHVGNSFLFLAFGVPIPIRYREYE